MVTKHRIRPVHHLVMLGIETILGTVAWNKRASIISAFRKRAEEPPIEPPRVVVDIVNHSDTADVAVGVV